MEETPATSVSTGATAAGQPDVRPMSQDERSEVFRLQQQGMGVREIARKFNRAPSTISRILRGTTGGGAPRMASGPSNARTAAGARTGTAGRTTQPSQPRMGGRAARPTGTVASAGTTRTAARPGGSTGKSARPGAAVARPATGRAGAAARATGGKAGGTSAGGVSRQEFRRLEQRIARIESSLARMSTMMQSRAQATRMGGAVRSPSSTNVSRAGSARTGRGVAGRTQTGSARSSSRSAKPSGSQSRARTGARS
jgi:transposase-like protein